MQTRRRFLAGLSSIGAAAMLRRPALAAEGPLETTTVRFANAPQFCAAPKFVAEELLRAEGFTDIRHLDLLPPDTPVRMVARGEADFNPSYAVSLIADLDAGAALTVLAGVHVGCTELFVHEPIRGIGDLKGKSVGVLALRSPSHLLLTLMAAHVGLDPSTDIRWVTSSSPKPIELFADGKIDAVLAVAPEPQQLRARNIGRVIVDTALDHPWSQYFCCMLTGNREFVRRYPNATKRVLRARAAPCNG